MGHRGGVERAAYSIRMVADETGIPAETLRVWERRYGYPKPSRRPGGGRLYDAHDIARLRLIAGAREKGYRPSDVLALADAELTRLVAAPVVAPAIDVAGIIDDVRNERVERARLTLRTLSVTLGPRAFVTDLATPLASALGTAWAAGTIEVRHEHLATALLSARLRVLLSTFEDSEEPPVVVLATLPGEAHILGLDLVAVYLASLRATPRLLGADTPPDQIAAAAKALGAAIVGISVPLAPDAPKVRAQIDALARALPRRTELWIGGAAASKVATASARKRVSLDWPEIDAAVDAARR